MSTKETPGARLRQRRVALDHVKRVQFLKHLDRKYGDAAPSERLIAALERDERTNIGPDTLRAVDNWYELPGGTFAAWLTGEDTNGPQDTKPTIATVRDGRVVTIDPDSEAGSAHLELHERTRLWIEEGRRILDEMDRAPYSQGVRPPT